MTAPGPGPNPPIWQDQEGYQDDEAGGTGVPTGYPPAPGTTPGSSGGGVPVATVPGYPLPADGDPSTSASTQPDPTTPIGDDGTRIGSVLTGPPTTTGSAAGPAPVTPTGVPAPPTTGGAPSGGNPFASDAAQVEALNNAPGAPRTDYTDTFHDFTEKDYKQNQAWHKAVGDHDVPDFIRPDGISTNDTDRIHFGVEEPDKLKHATDAQHHGKQQLSRYAQSINSGDIDAVGKADDILKAGEPGLAFFKFFAPAYNEWMGGGVAYNTLKEAYEAEYGMSFADYSTDSKTMADLSQQLVTIQQNLNNAYNALVPTWQGDAAATFTAKMAVFFKAASTVTQDVANSGKDVAGLVQGLQQLILAKAQTVSELYADELPNGIDGVMAQSMVKVAKGDGDKQLNLTAFYLLGGKIKKQGGFLHGLTNVVTLGALDDLEQTASENVAAQMAPQMAADWCNSVLVPQFETREQALNDVNTQTQQRIQQGFQEFTGQLGAIQDPFAGMASAHAPSKPKTPAKPGSGGAGSAGSAGVGGTGSAGVGGGPSPGGVPGGGGSVSRPPTPGTGGGVTLPQGTGSTTSQGAPDIPTTSDPTGGITTPSTGGSGSVTRPTGLPTGAGWIPSGVPLPSGWTEDPSTGEVLPAGWSVDPVTGQPTPGAGATGTAGTTGTTGTTAGTGAVDPKADIHKNKDGSVSLGPDKGLTISAEKGKNGVFTVSDTDPDGTKRTYRVHFDEHGDPVVTEVVPAEGADTLAGITSPAADLPDDVTSSGAGGIGGAGSIGGTGSVGGGGIGSGEGGGAISVGSSGIGGAGADHVGGAAAASAEPLPDGAHVGADNAMAASSNAPGSGSPVAGSAAPASGDAQHGGGVGGVPLGGGMGRGGGGGEQEAARKYGQRGDVVGEDDLEEWQRMGPVIGEQ